MTISDDGRRCPLWLTEDEYCCPDHLAWSMVIDATRAAADRIRHLEAENAELRDRLDRVRKMPGPTYPLDAQ